MRQGLLFCKKQQKTFALRARVVEGSATARTKDFGSFFQKRTAFSNQKAPNDMIWLAGQTLVALSAVTVASSAAFIAYQQMKIARLKLNHDLFERRFSVYVATYNFMIACTKNEGGTEQECRTFLEATRCAPFLFDKHTNEFIRELWRKHIDLHVFYPLCRNPVTPEAARGYSAKCTTAHEWVANELENVVPRFQKILDLSNISPFSIGKAPALSDAETLETRPGARSDDPAGIR